MLGSEGAFGVITALIVAVDPAPEQRVYEGWSLPSFWEGAAVLRRLIQDGPAPTVLRLSDEAETAVGLARPGQMDPAAAPPWWRTCARRVPGHPGLGGQI